MKLIELQNLLLSTDCFIKNNYFSLYLSLILQNIATKYLKGVTNKHHVIPLTYFTTKYNKTRREVENYSKTFGNIKVNLTFKDHIKAHYYLALCMSNHYKYGAISALNYLIGNYNNKNPNYTIDFTLDDLQLDQYQKLYEEGKKLNAIAHIGLKQTRTDEWNKKISLSNTNKKKIHLNDTEKAVNITEIETYLNLGWKLGPKPLSEERKQQCREAVKKATKASRLVTTGENNPAKRPEVRKKISKALTGKYLTEETKRKISKTKLAQKKATIIKINSIKYYGVREAMKDLHVSFYTLQNLIKGENYAKK